MPINSFMMASKLTAVLWWDYCDFVKGNYDCKIDLQSTSIRIINKKSWAEIHDNYWLLMKQ